MRALSWLVLTAGLSAQAPVGVCLKHQLDEGTRFAFAVAVESTLQFAESRKDTRTTFELVFDTVCGPTTNGLAEVRCTLRRLRAKIAAPNADVTYDSDLPDPPTGPLRNLAELLGGVFDVRVQTDGTIATVAAPELLEAVAKNQLGTDFRSLFAAYFASLPTAPVAPGATWENTTLLFGEHPGQGPCQAKHKFVAVTEGLARIEVSFTAPKPADRPGVRFELRESAGEVQFDVAKGRVQSATATLLARATRTAGDGDTSATSRLEVRATEVEVRPEPPTPTDPTKGGTPPRDDGKPGR